MLTGGPVSVAFSVINGTKGSGLPSSIYSKVSVFFDSAESCSEVSEAVSVAAWRVGAVHSKRGKSIIPKNTIIFPAVKRDASRVFEEIN